MRSSTAVGFCAEAETMLTRAFLAELIDPIEDEGLNAALTGVIEAWLLGS
jgi:Fe-S cluster assembly protein SufD